MLRLVSTLARCMVCLPLLCAVSAVCAQEPLAVARERIDFARDVQPLLMARCAQCHGPDTQEAQLRVDGRAAIFAGGVSGPTIKSGEPDQSLLYRRLLGLDDLDRMPLDEEPLSDQELQVVRRWIEQGAVWPEGVGAEVPIAERHWAYAAPQRAALPAVQHAQWPRNAIDYFVLAQMEQQQLAPAPQADRAALLRRVYLDLIGLPPSVAEVDAFVNDADPRAYERVVDRLLASPQYGVRWARPWLDAARYADSNGYQADQFRSVWPYRDWVIQALNQDMPFDQFTIWQIAGDLLPEATLAQKIASGFHRLTTCNVEAGVDPEENRVEQVLDRVNTTATVWLGTTLECAQCHNHKYDPFTQLDYYRFFAYFNNTPLEVEGDGVTYDFVGPKMPLPLPQDQSQRRAQAEQELADVRQQLEALTEQLAASQSAWEQSLRERLAADEGSAGDSGIPPAIATILKKQAEKRNKKETEQLRNHRLGQDERTAPLRKRQADLEKQLQNLAPETTLVMVEMSERRTTHVFQRGDFLSPGRPVTPGTPRVLHRLPQGAAANRLSLAQWLVAEDNPLVGRVVVNRWWAEIFGSGLVATLEDFGRQGAAPTHPQLLDWLAVEFREAGWSGKHMHRLIVMSATYQQSSRVTPRALERDPENRWLARGPRLRLSAESIRDNALAVSGLLSHTLSGPPIYPPQPDGIWRHVGRNAPVYATSQGDDRYRRGIYIVWRRSAPYASFVNFDAPDRASCVVRRPRTNTPLQALTLLNDPAYFEIARGFAENILRERPHDTRREQMAFAFRNCLARPPADEELDSLCGFWEAEYRQLQDDLPRARQLAGNPGSGEPPQVAAWVLVANVLLNLDATITKE
jgi:hypothetical protein